MHESLKITFKCKTKPKQNNLVYNAHNIFHGLKWEIHKLVCNAHYSISTSENKENLKINYYLCVPLSFCGDGYLYFQNNSISNRTDRSKDMNNERYRLRHFPLKQQQQYHVETLIISELHVGKYSNYAFTIFFVKGLVMQC